MTFTSVAQANSKTAEFARLFDLFDRVATRRTRRALTGDTSQVISADDIANVPAEFAPVLKNLSTIISLRALRDEEHPRRTRAASTAKPPRDTPTSARSTILAAKDPTPRVDVMKPSDWVEEPENPIFPLGERYPFTFKLMLHKLYDLDEWAEKVKDAVETSKSQFKPLAERVQNVVRDATASMKEREEKRSREKRSIVRSVLGASAKFKPPSTTKYPHSGAMPAKPEASRVLKKRCIGRRKSVNGPMSAGVWVYGAVISATEVPGPRRAVEITLSTPRDAGGVVENRARHRSLTALEEMKTRDTARRKVKITVPLLHEEVAVSVPRQPSSVLFAEPARQPVESESVVKRKRSMVSTFASESCKRATVKRPVCV
ncbi:hypothetical protein HD554DRAFT_2183032 [Boletus coccyginus]|nr:hypothetical protein HD554DRAFT_2183032 [Boletus coccyginus]